MQRSRLGPVRVMVGFLFVAAVLVLGCGQSSPPTPPGPKKEGEVKPPAKEASPEAKEPTPEAKLSAGELFKNPAGYKGKWVAATGIVPRVNLTTGPDGRTSARILVQDGAADDVWAEFDAAEWAKVPKLEDGVRYEVLGQVSGDRNVGVTLRQARFLGASKSAGPAAAATLTAAELAGSGDRYRDKIVQVKGVVQTGGPGNEGVGTATLDGGDKRFIVCMFQPGEFDKTVKAGRRGILELKGTVTDTKVNVILSGSSTVNATPTVRSELAVNVARDFARGAAKAEAHYKKNGMMLDGKVEAVSDNKITLAGFTDPKGKSPPQKVVAIFAPDWKERVKKVKAGDQVVVSGEFELYQNGELSLSNCWLIPK